MDLLLSWMSDDANFNVLIGFSVMSLFITELILGGELFYDSLFLIAYCMLSIILFFYTIIDTVSFSKAPSAYDEKSKIDMFELGESIFTLIAGLIANVCYIVAVGTSEITALMQLLAFSILMIAQYQFIIYFQMYPDNINVKVLQCSAFASAVSIMYLFLFEYEHFLHILTDDHGDDTYSDQSDGSNYDYSDGLISYDTTAYSDHHRRMASDGDEEYDSNTTTLKIISYSLFWCLMENFIWSFVTANHMMHHHQKESHQGHGNAEKSSNSEEEPEFLFVQSIPTHDADFHVNALAMRHTSTTGDKMIHTQNI